jgi:hypothetical protein
MNFVDPTEKQMGSINTLNFSFTEQNLPLRDTQDRRQHVRPAHPPALTKRPPSGG